MKKISIKIQPDTHVVVESDIVEVDEEAELKVREMIQEALTEELFLEIRRNNELIFVPKKVIQESIISIVYHTGDIEKPKSEKSGV